METSNILFLDVARLDDERVLRGGALVTDATTEPLEFRCTTPVRPTRLQRILWGARLEEHIAANLLGMPLLRSLKQPFGLIVVREAEFLELRDSVETPIIRAIKHAEVDFEVHEASTQDDLVQAQPGAGNGETASDGPVALLDSITGRFEPIVLVCHSAHPDDLNPARQVLAPVFQSRDVLEPFGRIQAAIEAVHAEDKEKGAR